VSDRVTINSAAWKMYTESSPTTLAGIGVGSFLDTTQARTGSDQQIHNTFLWLLVEGGPLMFGLFALALLSAILNAIRAAKTPIIDIYGIALFSSLVAWTVFSAANESMYQRQFWLLLALPDVLVSLRARLRVFSVETLRFAASPLSLGADV
jgi:hypothetical protein